MLPSSKKRVFICYRHDGGSELARLLYEFLNKKNYHVFMDVEKLEGGQFDPKLLDSIEAADNFIIIVSPGCLERCFHENDYMKREIAHAIKNNKNIIPIIMQPPDWPDRLPHEIETLSKYNRTNYSHEYYQAFLKSLTRKLNSPDKYKKLLIGSTITVMIISFLLFFIYLSLRPDTKLPGTGSQQLARNTSDSHANAKQKWYIFKTSQSPENHGVWTNYMPSNGAQCLQLSTKSNELKFNIKLSKQIPWCGIAVANTPDNWGNQKGGPAYDLKNASKLVFYARGDKGGESIQAKVAITGHTLFGDSAKKPAVTHWIRLSTQWKKYEINLKHYNLSRVITPFAIVVEKNKNKSQSFNFYLRNIYFELKK